MENMYRVNKTMYIAVIDLEKAFGDVDWEKLLNMMKSINIDTKDRRIIQILYLNEKDVIIEKICKS